MADESNPTQFTVELGKIDLTEEQIDTILNGIARTVASHIISIKGGTDFPGGPFNSFNSFNRFQSVIGNLPQGPHLP